MEENNTVIINGVEYVRKDAALAKSIAKMPYCIVRTYSAGVFAGYVESRNGKEVVIRNSRRIWYWDGANSLSQLAVDGTCRPENCKFACTVEREELTEAIEIINCTEKAKKSIEEVKKWVITK